MSNSRVRTTSQAIQVPVRRIKETNPEKKIQTPATRSIGTKEAFNRRRRQSRSEKKIALEQDVDKLKKKLRQEENVHRALERAFTRPLGVLPRLPPFLPSQTLELLAEVAVLEEEVARLEEQVVNFRQGLYQEAIYISTSKKIKGNASDGRSQSRRYSLDSEQLESLEVKRMIPKKLSSSLDFSENQPMPECVMKLCDAADEVSVDESIAPNELSEDILKCLMNILSRIVSSNSPDDMETSSSSSSGSYENPVEMDSQDAYGICTQFGKRDIGPYKHFRSVELSSNRQKLIMASSTFKHRLKSLFSKLESVDISKHTHWQKLAFWINIYNSCMMNAFLEQGIPTNAEMVVALMPKAVINVGGHLLSAMTIEHLILRLPYHIKDAKVLTKGTRNESTIIRGVFGLEWPEPLVTFALSCGSWSSPAVRVYTALRVERELEIAKRDYLQAAVGISKPNKLAIPKMLHWYLPDFAKDLESLMDWICLQLPRSLRTEAVECLKTSRASVSRQAIQILPYEFRFRYLLAP